MKQLATEALVLGRIDFGESGRILTLLTSNYGKISAIAKGVRKPKSRLAGGVELFSVSDIVFIDGKSEIRTLVSAQLKTNFAGISQDLNRSQVAYDILKFTNLYTESVCEDSYFTLVNHALEALNYKTIEPAVVWSWFGVRILGISGHDINLVTDAEGGTLDPTDYFNYDYQNMAFSASKSGIYASSHIKLLRLCQRAGIKAIAGVKGSTKAAQDLQQLITDCITYNAR